MREIINLIEAAVDHSSDSGAQWYAQQKASATRNMVAIYRGEYSGNKGGKFWTTDPEFARQFTQSGQAKEVLSRRIYLSDIWVGSADVYAGDPDAVDAAIRIASENGRKAVLLDEGQGEPKSIYVFDRSALVR